MINQTQLEDYEGPLGDPFLGNYWGPKFGHIRGLLVGHLRGPSQGPIFRATFGAHFEGPPGGPLVDIFLGE